MPSRRTPGGRDQDDDLIEVYYIECIFLYMVCIFFWYWRFTGANAIQLCTISLCHSHMVLVWLERERAKTSDARTTRSSRSRSGLTDILLSDRWTILLLISAWVVVALLLEAMLEFHKMWAAASPNSFTAVKYVLGLGLTLYCFLMPTSFWSAFRFCYPRRRLTRRPDHNEEALRALAIRDNRTATLKRSCAICHRGGPTMSTLSCGTAVHVECLSRWLQNPSVTI